MVSDFSYLRDLYPPVITLDQLYRICHLSKRKAKWLLESRIIPCQDSGKKTRRFKIQLDDVISYLEDTASGKKWFTFRSVCSVPKPYPGRPRNIKRWYAVLNNQISNKCFASSMKRSSVHSRTRFPLWMSPR